MSLSECWEAPQSWALYAKRFGISKKAAARMRERYLKQQLIDLLKSWAKQPSGIVMIWIREIMEEIADIRVKRETVVKHNRSKVTEEMIAEAKEVLITEVVQFNRYGKAIAWCHDDNRPSLFHGDKRNIAVCPVCDKKFNAIDVLMERDGYTFLDAVRSLL